MEFKLKSNISIPSIGVGTYLLDRNDLDKALVAALNKQYKLIDTATVYTNHQTIALSIAKFIRSDLFICTKFNKNDLQHFSVDTMCEKALEELNTPYLDAVLLHTPYISNHELHLEQLIKIKESGKIRCIGVSNFNIDDLEKISPLLNHIDINQIEFHPYLNQFEIAQYCHDHKIHIMAHSPFAAGQFLNDPALITLATSHKKSAYQIALRWLNQKGFTTIPRSSSAAHLAENQNIFDFSLTENEMKTIDSLNKNLITCPILPSY